jgi:chorismate mutase
VKLVGVVVFAMSWISIASAQNDINKLQPLVDTSARRVAIATQVAFAKWDSGAPVEDEAREEQVIAAAVREGEAKGLNRTFVSQFFRAQIEANKLVQYSLLADWHRIGAAPRHEPTNLTTTVRPELDQVQRELISELVDTMPIRESSECAVVTAKAVGEYLTARRQSAHSLEAIALDRALAANCNTSGQH